MPSRRPLRIGVLAALAGLAAGLRDAAAQSEAPLPGTAPAPEQAAPPGAAPPPAATPSRVRGLLISRYWTRWNGDAGDHDLHETLSLDLGSERDDPVTGHLHGRIAADLDGHTSGSARFFALNDTLGRDVDGRLYHAYADLHRVPGLAMLRIGRQLIHETPELAFFDGLRLETRPGADGALQFGGYGGSSAHLYEASPSGDLTVGAYGQARPWHGGRVRLDWMHLEDDVLLGTNKDDLLAGAVSHAAGPLQLDANYSRLEDHDRDVRARAAFADRDQDLLLQVHWYQLLRTQRHLALELDPFWNALQELHPYWQAGALVGKGLVEHVELQVGADLRRVDDEADIGTWNRDYDRWYTTLQLSDLPVEGCHLGLSADLWDGGGQDVRTWGADLGYRATDAATVSAGSYWSLYKFDLYANRERDHVRTWYCKLQYKASKQWSFDGSYEFEHSDQDDFHMLRLEATWRF